MNKDSENDIAINRVRNIILIVLGFHTLGAIDCGMVLIISPTGEMMGMPLSEFKNLPFSSCLMPSIILFTVLGILPFLLILALLKSPNPKWPNKSG